MKSFLSYLSLFLLFTPLAFAAAERIERIEIHGNTKTKAGVVRGLTELKIGEELTEKMLKSARDRVLSSGLFEDVRISKNRSDRMDYVVIDVYVEEKLSWFVAPSLTFSEDSLAGGGMFGESNLFGYNKKLLVYGDYGPSSRRAIIAYRDPGIMGSPVTLHLDSIVRWDRIIEYEKREEIRRVRLLEYGATLMPGYRWSPRFTSSVGAYFRKVDQELQDETKPIQRLDNENAYGDGLDIAIKMLFEYDDTTNIDGLVHGAKLSFETELSDNRFYSDFDYSGQELRFMSGVKFLGDYNWLNWMSVLLGQSLPYYQEYTVGGQNLKGYIERQFRGDTRYSMGEELVFPIHKFSRLIMRGALFWDSAIIYFKDDNFDRENWRNGVGGGLRFYLKGVVIPIVAFNAGWAIEEKTYATYLTVGATF